VSGGAEGERSTRLGDLRARMAEAGHELLWVPPSGDAAYLLETPVPRPPWGTRDPLTAAPGDGLLVGPDALVVVAGHSVWGRAAAAVLRGRPDVGIVGPGELAACVRGRPVTVPPHATLETVRALAAAGARVADVPWDAVAALRRVKSPWEVDRITEAQALCVGALAQAVAETRVGDTVLALRDRLVAAILDGGAEAVCSGPEIQVAGPRGALGFGDRSPAALAAVALDPGAVVTLNVGCVVDGFVGDLGRTVLVGEPGPDALGLLDTVVAAQVEAAGLLVPGVVAGAVPAAVAAALARQGVVDGVWPKAGHGIGLEHHEPPVLEPGGGEALVAGATLTVEVGVWSAVGPGAYCEDAVVVTADGVRWLSRPGARLVIS